MCAKEDSCFCPVEKKVLEISCKSGSLFKLHGYSSVHLSMKIEYGLHYDVQNNFDQKPVSLGFEGSSKIGKGLGTYDLGLLRDAGR